MPAPTARPLRAQAVFVRFATAFVACAALTVCAPRHDWREIRADEDHYRASMPARPDRMTRAIDLDGLAVSMTMQGARVEGVAFVVGAAGLPDDSVAVRERALAAMRTAMVRNIQGSESRAEAVAVPVVDVSGRVVGSAPGWRIDAAGKAGERTVSMHAVFASRAGHAWQAVVLGPDPDADAVRHFLDGFRIVE